MAKRLHFRGGTTEENDVFTGAPRELSIDTTKNTIRVHDGVTQGGHELASVEGDNEFTGNNTFTDSNEFTGDNVFSGDNEFSGNNLVTGNNEFTGTNTFEGRSNLVGGGTFDGSNKFVGHNEFTGYSAFFANNDFHGDNTFTGTSTFKGPVEMVANDGYTKKLSVKSEGKNTEGNILTDTDLNNVLENYYSKNGVDALIEGVSDPRLFAVATGAENVIRLDIPAVLSYQFNTIVMFRAVCTNTGEAIANINGLGNVSIKKDGNDLIAGDIKEGSEYFLRYNGIEFELIPIRAEACVGELPNIHDLERKTSPVFLDELLIADSEDGYSSKKITFNDIKENLRIQSRLESNIVVTVGTEGDFSTINEALMYLVRTYQPMYRNSGVTATVRLLSGFVMNEQVLVRGLDLGWVTIIGDDEETTVNQTALVTNLTEEYGIANYPVFGVSKGGTLPKISQSFRLDAENVTGNKRGVMAVGSGSGADVYEGYGVDGLGKYNTYEIDGGSVSIVGTGITKYRRNIKDDIEVAVGPGGDFDTINKALDYLVSNYSPAYRNTGVTATIILLPGFVMQEQVLVHGIDLSWITIAGYYQYYYEPGSDEFEEFRDEGLTEIEIDVSALTEPLLFEEQRLL